MESILQATTTVHSQGAYCEEIEYDDSIILEQDDFVMITMEATKSKVGILAHGSFLEGTWIPHKPPKRVSFDAKLENIKPTQSKKERDEDDIILEACMPAIKPGADAEESEV